MISEMAILEVVMKETVPERLVIVEDMSEVAGWTHELVAVDLEDSETDVD